MAMGMEHERTHEETLRTLPAFAGAAGAMSDCAITTAVLRCYYQYHDRDVDFRSPCVLTAVPGTSSTVVSNTSYYGGP